VPEFAPSATRNSQGMSRYRDVMYLLSLVNCKLLTVNS
jgi:hypothetical protein